MFFVHSKLFGMTGLYTENATKRKQETKMVTSNTKTLISFSPYLAHNLLIGTTSIIKHLNNMHVCAILYR